MYCYEGMLTAPLSSNRIVLSSRTDNIENTATVSLTVGLFTELLSGNALIKSVTVYTSLLVA
jgi:hypothetical protein